jgi:DNA-binding CsgD family transcriptional regulator
MTTMTGRPPKLTPADQLRLLYRYTTGISRRQLAAEFGIAHKTVSAYIRGTHKNPALRITI